MDLRLMGGRAAAVVRSRIYRRGSIVAKAQRANSLALACALTAVTACGDPSKPPHSAQLLTIPSPAIPPSVVEFVNPLRGQYENLLSPLFPQGNSSQHGFPAWPGSYDSSMRVSWRELQPADPRSVAPDAPDEVRYDFGVIDRALSAAGARGMRVTLRIYAYNSCCDRVYPNSTNVAIPDWLRTVPGASTTISPTAVGEITHVVPNWNSPAYLSGIERLLAALGRRYDGDERLSIFEFSGYGDFSENHIAYLRDSLSAPGPEPQDSVAVLGYFSQYRDQDVTAATITRLVAAHVAAFPRTQLVVTPQNPEIVRQMLADDVTARVTAPVGIRSDCLGVFEPLPAWAYEADSEYVLKKDRLVLTLSSRLKSAPVITEWCQLPAGADPRMYYEKGLRDVVTFHVSMTSSTNFPDREASDRMDPELFDLWSRANRYAGYRYSAEAVSGTESVVADRATVDVRWTNLGSAVASERWIIEYRIIDLSGIAQRTVRSAVDLSQILAGQPEKPGDPPVPASATERLVIDTAGLPSGTYTVGAIVLWRQHKPRSAHVASFPPMNLARAGREPGGLYPVATLVLP